MKAKDYLPQGSALLLIGAPGTGKTTLCSQLSRPYILNSDNNIGGPIAYAKSKGLPIDFEFDFMNNEDDGTPVPRGDRFERGMRLLQKNAMRDDIDSVIIDNLTGLSTAAVDRVRKEQTRGFGVDLFTEEAQGKKVFKADGPLQIQDWQPVYGLLYHTVQSLRAINKTFVLVAHVQDGPNGQQVSVPTKGMQAVLAGLFSEVWMINSVATPTAKGTYSKRTVQVNPTAAQSVLGLKSSIGLENEKEIDFDKLAKLLSNEQVPATDK